MLQDLQQTVSTHSAQIEALAEKTKEPPPQEQVAKAEEQKKTESTEQKSSEKTAEEKTITEQKPEEPKPSKPEDLSFPHEMNTPAVGLAVPPVQQGHEIDKWSADRIFQTAYNIRETDPAQASILFARVVRMYPQSALADNSLYWLGMIQAQNGATHKAIVFWDKILRDYPNSNRVPDALYQMALGYQKLQQKDKAVAALDRLKKDYRDTSAAAAAQALPGQNP